MVTDESRSWSAKNILKRKRREDEPKPKSTSPQADEEEEELFDELTCPVLAWNEYMKRTASMRGKVKKETEEEETDVPGGL